MRVIFAKSIGFCTGVKRAIGITENSLKKDLKPVQFLGETVHNEKVMERIKKGGGKLIFSPKEAVAGTLVIRAHGYAPFNAPKDIVIEDATCPLVKRAQKAAQSLSKEGYRVIIIGEKKHPEIKGILGYVKKYVKNKAIVIADEKEAEALNKIERMGVISQTTGNPEKVNQILSVLKKKTKKLKWINTLCPQVVFRQKELSGFLNKASGVLVIGSETSANTRRLAEIAKAAEKQVWQVNSLEALKKIKFDVPVLGVVSGTSAPDWEIKKVKKYLKNAC